MNQTNTHIARLEHKLLITQSCLDDLHTHIAHKDKYDEVINRLQHGDERCARHAVRGATCQRFKTYESTITGDLRLCWSYASHFAEPSIILWALDGHDRVFRRLKRMTGERFKELRFVELDAQSERERLLVGCSEFQWRGVRPPTLLELTRDESLGEWVSDHLALSEEQSLESVRAVDEGPMLLSGGGGSGKTTLLIDLLLRQLAAGERPLLVTYHDKLADYCKRLVGDSPLRPQALECIKTIDELLKELLEGLELHDHLQYLSQEESRALFVRSLPEELRDAAWAEFRGMWKGRVDVDEFVAKQQEIHSIQARQQSSQTALVRTAEGALLHIDELSRLSDKERRQLSKEAYWRAHPRKKISGLSPAEQRERAAFYERERAEAQAQAEEQARLEELSRSLERQKRAYYLSSKRYGRDVRFLNDESLIQDALRAYEGILEQRGGDRLNACLEVLTRVEGIESSYTSLLIDEVQDFTRLELQLLSVLMPNPRRWVIAGDENQIVNPSGFKWERVKEVIWWSAQRLQRLSVQADPIYHSSHELLQELSTIEPVYLSVNYRNPDPIKRLAERVLDLKRHEGWLESPSLRDARHVQAHYTLDPLALESEAEVSTELSAEESPWAWQPMSLPIYDAQSLYQHIILLSKTVPSFCLIVFSQKEKRALIKQLKALMSKDDPEIDFERVLTPLEVKGLEFDLVLALNPPLPQSEIEGIRDFEFNQLYVSATRARTSLAYLWLNPTQHEAFCHPLNRAAVEPELSSEPKALISMTDWGHLLKLSHLHHAQDSADWAKSAARYAGQGQHKLAAEVYRVGGYYKESAELLEQIGELEGAVRDYRSAALPIELARCEAKLAEQRGQLKQAFEAWERYAQATSDFEGLWRCVEGSVSAQSGLRPIAHLTALSAASEGALLTRLGRQEELQAQLHSSPSAQRRFKDQQSTLAWLMGEQQQPELRDEGSVRRQLRDLRQSPRARAVHDLSRSEELHKLINPSAGLNQDLPPEPLSIADLELLLGAGAYYERLRDQKNNRDVLSVEISEYPWTQLPLAALNLFKRDKQMGLPASYKRYGSLRTANEVMWQSKLRVERYPAIRSARKVMRQSLQAASYQWKKALRFARKSQDRGLLRPDVEVVQYGLSAKPILLEQWTNDLTRAYHSSGHAALLGDEEGRFPVYEEWAHLDERFRGGLDELVAIMGQLRLSHSPTRINTAHRFAELWVALMLDLVGHWIHQPAIDSLTYLEDEVIERLSSCSMSELRPYLTQWERKAWQALQSTELPESRAERILIVQGGALQHMMGLWSMAQALFLRGTWAGFINEKLKLAEKLTSFGYTHLRAANSHWVGLTFMPLYGLMSAMMKRESEALKAVPDHDALSDEERAERVAIEARLKHIKEQRELFIWALSQADSLSIRTQRLSQEAYQEIRGVWRSGREWGKLIFDIGEQELLVFLELLNRYRERKGLQAFTPEDLQFHEGSRRLGAVRRGGESLWLRVMSPLGYASPLAQFQDEGREGELPSAGATLLFAIEQGYTPLALELFEDKYYVKRAQERLVSLAQWSQHDAERASLSRELSVLCATPLRTKSRWLESALLATRGEMRSLLTFKNSSWLQALLRAMRANSAELPAALSKGVRLMLTLWHCLDEQEQEHARVALFEIARLWSAPLSDAIEGLLLARPHLLSSAYDQGERWLLLSPLSAQALQAANSSPTSIFERALLWA